MGTAILMTILYDWLVRVYGHEQRFTVIFGVGGGILALATIFLALIIWSHNFGQPYEYYRDEYDDEEQYIKESHKNY